MKRSQLYARRIQSGLVCGLLLFVCCMMLPGCEKGGSDTKSSDSATKRSDSDVRREASETVCSLINKRGTGWGPVEPGDVTLEKIRQSPDDPDTYFAKAVYKTALGYRGMFDVKIEFVGDMLQVTMLE